MGGKRVLRGGGAPIPSLKCRQLEKEGVKSGAELLSRAKLNPSGHPMTASYSFLCCCPAVSQTGLRVLCGCCVLCSCSHASIRDKLVPAEPLMLIPARPCPGLPLCWLPAGQSCAGEPRRCQGQSLILGLQLPLVMGFSFLRLAGDTPVLPPGSWPPIPAAWK